ncbi:MAG: S9 family peptidase [Pirellulales bacterium]|nr:S9 family peptidase [Pirellulales bacterium]
MTTEHLAGSTRSFRTVPQLCWILGIAVVLAMNLDSRADEPVDPHRPAAIATTGVPVVPEALFDRLNQYQNVRAAGFSGWAPTKDGLLIQTRFGNSIQLHRVYEPAGRREQITFFDEPVGGTFIPEARDGAIVLSMSSGGDENNQLYLLDRTNGRATLLTDGKSRNLRGPILDDGRQMIVASNRRNGRDTDLYTADPRRPDSMKMLFEVDGQFWSATDWSRDGSLVGMLRFVSGTESYPGYLRVGDKKLTMFDIPGGDTASSGGVVFTPDAGSAYLTSDARGEFHELARVKLDTQKLDWLTGDIPWNVTDVEVDPQTGQVAFVVNDDGASRLYLLEGNKYAPVELPLGIIAGLEFSPDSTRLGFTLARPEAPADVYSLSLGDKQLTRWTYSEIGGLNPQGFVVPTRIRYPSFDGREIPAYYFRPPTASKEKRAPVLINIHGGPESQYRPIFSGMTQYHVGEMGIAVIAPNVRGSDGYGKTYLKLDNAELREDSVKDIGALLDWIAQQPELDPERVAVAGGSYGGYMVLASLVNFPERIRAGIDRVGIANFITFLERTSAYRQDLRRAEYGDERDPKMRAFFEKISPANRVDQIQSALLVAHGINDPRVPFAEAQQIAEKVRAAGRPVWTVYADNEGHGFAKKDNADYLNAVEVLFLEENLVK